MIAKVEIKDEKGIVNVALRSVGFNINKKQTELMLNVVDYIRETKGEATIKDMVMLEEMVESLFKE